MCHVGIIIVIFLIVWDVWLVLNTGECNFVSFLVISGVIVWNLPPSDRLVPKTVILLPLISWIKNLCVCLCVLCPQWLFWKVPVGQSFHFLFFFPFFIFSLPYFFFRFYLYSWLRIYKNNKCVKTYRNKLNYIKCLFFIGMGSSRYRPSQKLIVNSG